MQWRSHPLSSPTRIDVEDEFIKGIEEGGAPFVLCPMDLNGELMGKDIVLDARTLTL